MRRFLRCSRRNWVIALLWATLSAATIAGCDSGPSSTELSESKKARTEAINQAEQDPVTKTRSGKKGAIVKSIKGRGGDASLD